MTISSHKYVRITLFKFIFSLAVALVKTPPIAISLR